MTRRVGLEETDLFRELGPERLGRLHSHLKLQPYWPREYLYFEGQSAEHLWIVRSGEVRTVKGGRSGRVMTLEHLRPGDAFGVAAILTGSAYTDTAEGMVEGEVWRLPRRVMLKVLDEEPSLVQRLLSIVANRLEDAHDRLCSFAHDSVPARIARLILVNGPQGEKIEMTRRALGDEAGTTVETTIRVLRSFERAGWVEGGIGWIRVVDRTALERIADGERPAR
jgi:CRP/FNR family transcriptional regulator